jgi:hypothetical protein
MTGFYFKFALRKAPFLSKNYYWHHLFGRELAKIWTMKKFLILMATFGAFATVRAQSSREEARRIVLGQPKNGTSSQQGRTVILGNDQGKKVYRTNRSTYYAKKSNPGKHLGWYKGKGNPHRYGANPGRGKKG